MKNKNKLFAAIVSCSFITINCFSQNSLVNNGITVVSNADLHLVVIGDIINQNNGTFDNSGTIHVSGNWTNNAANTAFINSSAGKVILSGDTQQIAGSNPTLFSTLELAGTGIKQLSATSVNIEDSLLLNDREFDLGANTVNILNTGTGAITRTTGFCSSLPNGGLARNTNSTAAYSFPVGSSVGTTRYRPVDVMPNSAAANMFKVRMANADASTEGYGTNITNGTLCTVNNQYFHNISQISGTATADIAFYFDTLTDGFFNTIAHWQISPNWQDIQSTYITYSASPSFSKITKTAWNDFNPYTAFALGISAIPVVANATSTSICAGSSVTLTGGGANSYSWSNGISNGVAFTPTSSATYTVTGTGANGCSNTDTITITVNNADNTTTTNSNTITANATGAGYQWIDCNNGNAIIPGETAQSITATASGNYAVTVTQNGCTVTSACVNITVTGIEQMANSNLISVYPNPTTNKVVLNFNGTKNIQKITLLDVQGKIVYTTGNVTENELTIDLSELSDGIYALQVLSNNQLQTTKIIKQ